ncbi:hypothetical protein DC345_09535 [Paenibacillus taichungensis]|uniref:Uncharacterized protein n=1 Tax=Paenibacillus taichungensis TaxID=484184 RepID=A0A329QU78_9BACL|nr:hypothetical protein DC345_09535 [Paenibacillus taichungensis]
MHRFGARKPFDRWLLPDFFYHLLQRWNPGVKTDTSFLQAFSVPFAIHTLAIHKIYSQVLKVTEGVVDRNTWIGFSSQSLSSAAVRIEHGDIV